MTLSNTAGYVVVLLVLCTGLENQGHIQRLDVFSQESLSSETSFIHTREKRQTSTDYEVQAAIKISDLESIRLILATLTFPLRIDNSTEITDIETTTVCSVHPAGYQCTCEESFAWSYNSCINHEACDAVVGDTCGCINGLPADGLFCQSNTSTDPADFEIVVDVRIPVSTVPSNFIDIFRQTLRGFSFPQRLSGSLQLTAINLTTGCFPNSTGELQCRCEEQFVWPWDKCATYRPCSNTTTQTCGCINGLPSDGTFCEPITILSTTTPMMNPTTPMMNTTMMNTTTPMMNTTTPMMNTTMMNTTTPMMNTTMMNTTTPTMITTTTTTTPVIKTTTTTTPVIKTTTPVIKTTTTPVMTTTTPMITTTPTMITTTPVRTTSTNVPVPEENLTLTINIDFNPAYSNMSHPVYQSIAEAIQNQSKEHITDLRSARIIGFRSGSTIVTYAISAPSIEKSQTDALKTGIFKELVAEFPMIFDSETPLQFNPAEVFFNKSVTVTCGPPPEDLSFGTSWTAEWRRDDELINEDAEHSFAIQDGAATLTVSRFFITDNGLYECKLKRADNSIFRQRSNGVFSHKKTPQIQVKPVRQNVKCGTGNVTLQCSVNRPYEVEFLDFPSAGTGNVITAQFVVPNCTDEDRLVKFTCRTKTNPVFKKEIILELSAVEFTCKNRPVYGNGTEGFKAVVECEDNEVGEKTAVCMANGKFEDRQDNCILQPVQNLLEQSEFLNSNSLPEFLDELSNVTVNFTTEVVESPATINAIVDILNNLAKISLSANIIISRTSMEDVLLTVGVLTTARDSWITINMNDTRNSSSTRSNSPPAASVSSILLQSLETITRHLTNDTFNIETPSILLNKTTFNNTFNADFNSSVEINITEADGGNTLITVLTFASMDNVLPARDETNSSLNIINGRVVLVQSSTDISNISFTFDIRNNSLVDPQCVFWNFSLFNGLGGWDDEGCMLEPNDDNETVTCNCNHLTSFSILMSPYSQDDPGLAYVTYIGVGISMASLVICLIIEAVIWRKIRKNNTSYLRHVSIVNIAISLLIANIWFIIGAAISEGTNPPACSTATFFIHFFYLALFFWMLASALLLLYRAVSVFEGGLSKRSMLAIGFCLGYGAPLIIATITIAVTAPKETYIRATGVCWLNWTPSYALLAFVVPALLIVVINFMILLVVMYKMLSRRVTGGATQAGEKHVLVVIARSLAVLTPFFGLTWSLGVGTLVAPSNIGIHYSFAFFNSLQGFFILVFGTLLDKKVRSEIAIKSQTSRSGTRSTSGGNSSSGLGFLWKWRRGRDGYNVSSGASTENQSSSNT